ncbi:unnamed protein product [Fusarium graminearum]|uniref:Chromosome 3, complete genome n=1 Tax=Gibberella zeae (strain ATCC MYA-4620 / CBS 123657 / FGSC 9075 / NRRL 31084 / PH-1) TaxID=229533 RepID=I1S3Q4_GIBZE|nr:hypothetical protein FGSG_11448 [Fusarium graminearum PH-1]ESU18150.1 hypothetical protein FGSG_11448 [Fusarium graminearum PH-1]CEF86477.1 unnamed protein product [Fusarium graminearum]CZS86144.1 unnamed protein product [Fusarium graminearum]|eukprot:XP_011325772.1 hypothetical protein FGSG_11448 [Fusarium graminearum PH-1]
MRLVNTNNLQLEFFTDDVVPDYAILSHTWEQEEVLFHDIGQESANLKKGYAKLKNCCHVAKENGFDYIWDDTCCIDKASSAELSEAINSMYRYYQEANICYVYLADVSAVVQIPDSRWFTRGWTLQELIAPHEIIFFDQHWQELGTKTSLVSVLSERTSIPKSILCNTVELDTTSIAQRMSWAADRVTTRKEDSAYSLMGLFGINMPLLYGEGEKAFYRLQEEIMRVSDDHSLFAWRFSGARGGLLAPTPAAFKHSRDIIPWNPFAPYNSPFTITNKGVHMDVSFIPRDASGRGLCVLFCTTIGRRDSLIAIHLRDLYLTMEHFDRCMSSEFQWINLDTFSLTQYPARPLCVRLHAPTISRRDRRPGGADEAMNRRDYSPQTHSSLSEAALNGDTGAVWFMLANNVGVLSEVASDDARLAVCIAARGGHESLVTQLMTRRDTSGFLADKNGRTPLSYAAEAGQEHIVKVILSSARIHPEARDSDGLTALWYAVHNGHRACARLLLQKGRVSGNVGGSDNRPSALCQATSAGDVELVKLLVQNEALVGARGEPALCLAAAIRSVPIATILLEHGADPDERDAKRNTPLHLACVNDDHDLVALLMRRGASPDRLNTAGKTELAFATLRGNIPLVKLLLENGADPKAKCANGKTAAAYAQGQEMKSLFTDHRWYKTLIDRTSTNRSGTSGRS